MTDIVWKHFEEDEGNLDKIKKKLMENNLDGTKKLKMMKILKKKKN